MDAVGFKQALSNATRGATARSKELSEEAAQKFAFDQ